MRMYSYPMKILFTYIITIGIIALAVFLLSWQGVSFMPERNDASSLQPMETQKPTMAPEGAVLAQLETTHGNIIIELYSGAAPKTVENFIKLAESGFYNNTKFHRVIKDFMIQGGDPNSKDDDWSNDGMGGPGYAFEDEFNEHKVVRGALAMANSGPDTNGSQFFIVTAEAAPWLDGKHTVFGRVVGEGMSVVDKIESVATNENDHPLNDVVVRRIVITK